MLKLVKKLALIALPIVIYFAIFIVFEPYNYFGLKHSEYTADSAIVRVRQFNADPADVVILGDSRVAHFDMDKVEEYVGERVSQLSFGGASLNESMDLLEYALEKNENIHTVYFAVSFYTLNESYYKDRMSSIETIATNPFAYMLNFNYNVEMLNEIKWFIKGEKNVASDHHGDWKEEDYYYPDGTPRQYRRNLEEYALNSIYPVCENYKLDEADAERYIRLAQKCRDMGITVYTVLPPMDDSLKDLVIEPLGIYRQVEPFIRRAEECTTVLNYEYRQPNYFTSDEFYDGFHLDDFTGLPEFTQMLFER